MDRKDIVSKIKNKLQYPKLTLELLRDLRAVKRRKILDEFIEDALKEIGKIIKLLKKLEK